MGFIPQLLKVICKSRPEGRRVNKLVTVLIKDSSCSPDGPHSLSKSGNSLWFFVFLHSDQRRDFLREVCYVIHLCANIASEITPLFPLPFLGLILLFYTALYVFLAAMFGGCMFCLMWSISPYHPTYNDRVMPPGKYNGKLKPLHCILYCPSVSVTSN